MNHPIQKTMNRVSLINKPTTLRQREVAMALALQYWRSERARQARLDPTRRRSLTQPPEPLPPSPFQ